MLLFKRLSVILLALLVAAPLLAQSVNPTVEVVLSTAQAQKGDTIYADVVIHNAHNMGGADVGITTDDCLRVVERQPGNFLPSTSEGGGFSPFAQLSDHATRFAASIIDRARIVSGDGTFYRVKMEATCDDAAPEVKVTFAQLVAFTHPETKNNDVVEYKLDKGNISVVNASLKVQPGAVVSTPAPMINLTTPAIVTTPATNQNTILIAALGVMVLAVVGMIVLLLVYQRQRRTRQPSSS